MLKRRRQAEKGDSTLFEEKPENKGMELIIKNIKTILLESDDINFHELYINSDKDLPVTLVFVDGLIDQKTVSDNIIKPLTQETILGKSKNLKEAIDLISHGTIYYSLVRTRDNIDDCISDILSGSAALVFDSEKTAITFDAKGFEKRAVEEPTGENVIKGAKDAFVEVLRVNTSLVRRKIKTQNLRIKETIIGRQTLTSVSVIYIEALTNKKIIEEINKRLDKIKLDGVITPGTIEEYIIDNKYSVFPQIMYTERSDKFCDNILEGRVGILIDGLPTAYIVPAVFNQYLQAPEDYSQNYVVSSALRLIRYVAMLMTIMLPAFYVSIATFHQEMIPSDLAISIIASKEDVPFPAFIEVIFMLVAFEILLEAGLRLPKTIGQAVSIVGALVVGQAAVQAKFVSPAVVVAIATTGIAGFTMPNQDFSNALRVWRFILVLCASIAGLFSLTIGLILLVYQLGMMESFGVPYLSPFVANEGEEVYPDTLLRFPLYTMKKRPSSIKPINKRRQR